MGAQLNIKSEDAYRLASRLSELTGESLIYNCDERIQRIRATTADIRAAMGDNPPSSDHACLYDDETGLPR